MADPYSKVKLTNQKASFPMATESYEDFISSEEDAGKSSSNSPKVKLISVADLYDEDFESSIQSSPAQPPVGLISGQASVPPLPPRQFSRETRETVVAAAQEIVDGCVRERVALLRQEFKRHQQFCARLKQFMLLNN